MNAEQKHRAAELLSAWRATAYALHADRMADLLQELVDAPEPEPVAYIEHHKGGDNLVWDNPGGKYSVLYTAPPARADILDICDALKIGAEARTETVIIESIGNALRRSRCLDAVERDLFTSQIEDEESGELIDDCPLNWGDEPDEYVASVKELLRLSAPKPSELLTTTNPAQISSSPAEAPADVEAINSIDARFCGRLALILECVILDPHGHFDLACQLLEEYKAEWEKVNPSPPTFMGEPMPPERRARLLEMKAKRNEQEQSE